MRQVCDALYGAYLKDCWRFGRVPVSRDDDALLEVAWRIVVVADMIGTPAVPLDDGVLALAVVWKEDDAVSGGALSRKVSRLCA